MPADAPLVRVGRNFDNNKSVHVTIYEEVFMACYPNQEVTDVLNALVSVDAGRAHAKVNYQSFYNQPDADMPEVVTSDWQSAIDAYLDTVMNTAVMRKAQEFLTKQGEGCL
ncbi:hypothetical protein COOONC_23377 [Cooperia oncophora]